MKNDMKNDSRRQEIGKGPVADSATAESEERSSGQLHF
jgi:hypothetical protein